MSGSCITPSVLFRPAIARGLPRPSSDYGFRLRELYGADSRRCHVASRLSIHRLARASLFAPDRQPAPVPIAADLQRKSRRSRGPRRAARDLKKWRNPLPPFRLQRVHRCLHQLPRRRACRGARAGDRRLDESNYADSEIVEQSRGATPPPAPTPDTPARPVSRRSPRPRHGTPGRTPPDRAPASSKADQAKSSRPAHATIRGRAPRPPLVGFPLTELSSTAQLESSRGAAWKQVGERRLWVERPRDVACSRGRT